MIGIVAFQGDLKWMREVISDVSGFWGLDDSVTLIASVFEIGEGKLDIWFSFL